MTDTRGLVYWADGAGSDAVYRATFGLLEELRWTMAGNRGIALYRPHGRTDSWLCMCDTGGRDDGVALPNEPIQVNKRFRKAEPRHLVNLVLQSTLRPFKVAFSSGLSIPWADDFGEGVVILGLEESGNSEKSLESARALSEARAIVKTLESSRLSGSLTLQRQMSDALRRLLSSLGGPTGSAEWLSSLVGEARELFRSDTAYLALPDEDGRSYFFAALSNVNTVEFRRLRMEFGQGLGGLARTQGRPVSSLRYEDDHRLYHAPVSETMREGIKSAVAAPLFRGSEISGVLYVGSRTPRPYSDTDERVLAEFAEYISLAMDRPEFRDFEGEARILRAQEDLAHELHDSVVRSLMQIGFAAEQISLKETDSSAANSISVIQRVTEEALSSVRERIDELVPSGSKPISMGAIVDRLRGIPLGRNMERDVVVVGEVSESGIAADVAEAILHIGAEAITNSVRHASARYQSVELHIYTEEIRLRVADDGRGSPTVTLDPRDLSEMRHLGIASMHRRAKAVGGRLTIESRVGEGTTVTFSAPRRSG